MILWCVILEKPALLGTAHAAFVSECEAYAHASKVERNGYQFGIFVERRNVVAVDVHGVIRWDLE